MPPTPSYQMTMRLHRRRKQIAASEPTPPPPLTVKDVIDVNFDGPSGSLEVQFEVPVGASMSNPVDAGADPAKWTAFIGGTLYIGSSFLFDGGTSFIILFSDYGSGTGPNTLSYSADPSDILDTSGAYLGAFVDRPI